jgi:hypothetical protein
MEADILFAGEQAAKDGICDSGITDYCAPQTNPADKQ